jgi:glycosyltransferase involved in cell wall biosynthesis
MQEDNIRVVIPCYDADATIEKCISSVLDSNGIDFELIIVDDGENNKIPDLKNKYPIKVIKTEGRAGAGKARNSGAYGFNGSYVIFIDSDVQIYPDTLAALMKPLKDKLAEATVGSYSKITCKSFYQTYKHNYISYRYSGKQGYISNSFWSAICAIDYETFKAVKGFEESFFGAGPEDIDLGIKFSKAGARILSVPGAGGIHLADYTFAGLIKNDLRKGSEDIYIHLTRKIALRYNRHVARTDIISVFLACSLPLLLILHNLTGIVPILINILTYFIMKINFTISAFSGEGYLFMIGSLLLTYVLDVVRGIAVVRGTLLYFLESINPGDYKPFIRKTV